MVLFFNQWDINKKPTDINFQKIKFVKVPTSKNNFTLARSVYAIEYNGTNHFTSSWEENNNEVIFNDIAKKEEVVKYNREWNPKFPTLLLYKALPEWNKDLHSLFPKTFQSIVFFFIVVIFRFKKDSFFKIFPKYLIEIIINDVFSHFVSKFEELN